MRTFIFIPPLAKMSGGLAVLYQVAGHLKEGGHDVRLVAMPAPEHSRGHASGTASGSAPGSVPGLEERAAAGFQVIPFAELQLTARDIWLTPEGWPNALAPGVKVGARTLVFAQGWNQMLSVLPQGVRWKDLPVSFAAVSEPVAWFMRHILGVPVAGLLPPAVSGLFQPGDKPEKRVRIAWMPRKNRALAEQIRQIAEAGLGKDDNSPALEWVPLHNLPLTEVAALMSGCHLFLNTAFPEGFGLPPLEAMASGAVPIGFTGFGGWDYMRQGLPGLYAAPLPLRERSWSGNGLYASDGDVLGAAVLLEKAVRMVAESDPLIGSLREQGLKTARAYGSEAQGRAVMRLWREFLLPAG